MGYGANARRESSRALEAWLCETAHLARGHARAIAHSLADRPELTIKRKALDNVLESTLGTTRARACCDALCRAGILTLAKGDAHNPAAHDILAIEMPSAQPVDAESEKAPSLDDATFTSRQLAKYATTTHQDSPQIQRHLEKLQQLDAWLVHTDATPPTAATIGQRAFEIFNDEKALDAHLSASFTRLLKRLGIDEQVLHISDVHVNSLKTFIPHQAQGPVLVVENGDSFTTLRYFIGANPQARIFGQRIGGVIHGAGKAVCTPHLLDDTLRAIGYQLPYVLYWGDIDRSGVSELTGAREANDTEIRVARPFYKAMVRLQKQRTRAGIDPEPSGKQAYPEQLDAISRKIPLSARWVFLQTIRNSQRIPQEIIQLEHLTRA